MQFSHAYKEMDHEKTCDISKNANQNESSSVAQELPLNTPNQYHQTTNTFEQLGNDNQQPKTRSKSNQYDDITQLIAEKQQIGSNEVMEPQQKISKEELSQPSEITMPSQSSASTLAMSQADVHRLLMQWMSHIVNPSLVQSTQQHLGNTGHPASSHMHVLSRLSGPDIPKTSFSTLNGSQDVAIMNQLQQFYRQQQQPQQQSLGQFQHQQQETQRSAERQNEQQQEQIILPSLTNGDVDIAVNTSQQKSQQGSQSRPHQGLTSSSLSSTASMSTLTSYLNSVTPGISSPDKSETPSQVPGVYSTSVEQTPSLAMYTQQIPSHGSSQINGYRTNGIPTAQLALQQNIMLKHLHQQHQQQQHLPPLTDMEVFSHDQTQQLQHHMAHHTQPFSFQPAQYTHQSQQELQIQQQLQQPNCLLSGNRQDSNSVDSQLKPPVIVNANNTIQSQPWSNSQSTLLPKQPNNPISSLHNNLQKHFISNVKLPEHILVTRAFELTITLCDFVPRGLKVIGYGNSGKLFGIRDGKHCTVMLECDDPDGIYLVQVGFYQRNLPFGAVRLSGNSISSVRMNDYKLTLMLAVDATLGMRKSIVCSTAVSIKRCTVNVTSADHLLRIIAEQTYVHPRRVLFHGKNWKETVTSSSTSSTAPNENPAKIPKVSNHIESTINA